MYLCREASHLALHECIPHIPFIDPCSLSIDIKMLLWHIFLNWYLNWLSPLIDILFVLDKKGENIVFIVFDPFVDSLFRTKRGRKFFLFCFCFYPFIDDWQKGGERCWVLYAYLCFAYIKFNWYLEHVLFLNISLVSRAFYCLCISMHVSHVSYSLHIYVYLFMHELRGSFFEA